jgi:hypothetical protein
MKRLVLALAAVFGGACASSTMQLGRTAPKGQTVTSVGGGLNVYSVSGKPQPTPMVAAGLRYGAGENWDVGARLWLPFYEVDARYQLARAVTESDRWDVAVGAGVGYVSAPGDRSGEGHYLHALGSTVSIVCARHFANGSQLLLTPKVADFAFVAAGTTANLVFTGGSLGYAYPLSKTVYIVPEVSGLVSVVGSLSDLGTLAGASATMFRQVQAGVGLVFSD